MAEDKDTFQRERSALMRKRLLSARAISGLTQLQAAEKLGYRNSSSLSKIESGQAPIPGSLILKASSAYGVSTDYLLGASDFPEKDPSSVEHAAVLRTVQGMLLDNATAVATALLRSAAMSGPSSVRLQSISRQAMDVVEAFERVKQLNPAMFDEMKGGSRLVSAVSDLRNSAGAALKELERQSHVLAAIANAKLNRRPSADLPLFGDDSFAVHG